MSVLPFSRGDVRANRSGTISHAQRARILENIDQLSAEARAHLTEAALVAGGFVLVLGLGGIPILELWLIAGGVAVLLCGFGWLNGRRLRRLHADVAALSVSVYEGLVEPQTWLDRAGIKRYGFTIAKRTFRIPPHVYEQINADRCYRVYWGTHSGELLSMEGLN